MRKTEATLLTVFGTILLCLPVYAQENDTIQQKELKNALTGYVGFFAEFNFNYERTVLLRQHSFTRIRAGYGKANLRDFRCWADYMNVSLVHLVGRKSSHLELGLGIKYPLSALPEGINKTLVPDLFAGYRYEKPDGRLILRAGINYPSLFNVGAGFKF